MNKNICVFPGTFDPPTKGHVDIIRRAANIFDEVYVALLVNTTKHFMFSKEDREKMLIAATQGIDGVCVVSFNGLLIDFAKKIGAGTIVRGARNEIDFSYEHQMHCINSQLSPKIDTIIFPSNSDFYDVSSTFIREIITFKGDISSFVPKEVCDMIYRK